MSQRALRLQLVPDEPDQALRLARFRQEHPGVIIGEGGFGTWQAARDPLSLTMGESYAAGYRSDGRSADAVADADDAGARPDYGSLK